MVSNEAARVQGPGAAGGPVGFVLAAPGDVAGGCIRVGELQAHGQREGGHDTVGGGGRVRRLCGRRPRIWGCVSAAGNKSTVPSGRSPLDGDGHEVGAEPSVRLPGTGRYSR